jgi:hypothetical protein
MILERQKLFCFVKPTDVVLTPIENGVVSVARDSHLSVVVRNKFYIMCKVLLITLEGNSF